MAEAKTRGRTRRAAALFLAVGLTAAAAVAFFLARRSPALSPGRWKDLNVLVLTVDTLRADRLATYGFREIRTPAIDSLAASGVLFENCFATTPLTLPSHTSLFTGTYPLRHGVRDNGGFVVPSQVETMAELFAARGYDTGAFVGAFVLDSRWGLDQGFGQYFDDFDLGRESIVSLGDIERRGDEVMDAALAWFDRRRSGKPFFLWVHLFDPHSPYEPPSPFREEYPERPYIGEIAFSDSQIARLLARLEEKGVREKTVIVFAGDHGESFGEHEEQGHGFFIYQPTLHVPLIVSFPSKSAAGSRRREVVSLVDVFPTVISLFGLPMPGAVQGRSLAPLLSGRGPWEERPVYSETWYPRLHYGWSALQSLQDGRFKLIESSDPELYDLRADPQEAANLVKKNPSEYLDWKRRAAVWLDRWSKDAFVSQPRTEDPETIAKLASLGYIGAGSAQATGPDETLPSPRGKIELYNKLQEARERATASELEQAERLLLEVLEKDPGIIDAYIALGNIRLRLKKPGDAIRAFREAMERKPADPTLVLGLATAQMEKGDLTGADQTLLDGLKLLPEDSRIYLLLGHVAELRKDRAKSSEYFERVLKLDPTSGGPHSVLAENAFERGDLEEAERQVQSALRKDPKVRGARYIRARILEKRGDAPGAVEEYRREFEVSPGDTRVFDALLRLYRALGRLPDEEAFLQKAIEARPEIPAGYLYLAKNYMDRNLDLQKAVELAQAGLEHKPRGKDLALAYFLLADLYSRLGNAALSAEYAEKGKAAVRKAQG